MVITFLTKTGGLLGPIASALGWIMNGIYEFFHLFGIQNIALTIIIFTFIVRALMIPLTIKQQKFSKLSSKMNPELQKIQAKYKGKKDQASMQKQQIETQAVYQKYGANPTAGCLPLLITLPIMFALYRVIYNIPAYINEVYKLYEYIAIQIQATPGYQDILAALAETVTNNRITDFTSINSIIDFLQQFGSDNWAAFASSFSGIQNTVVNGDALTVADTIDNIKKVNGFIGLNISNKPGLNFPAVLIPIIAGALQFIQGKQMQVKNQDMNKDNPAASAMNSMNIVMPIMSIFFCISLPIGVGLYWIASSVFAIVQQFFVNKYMDRIDVDELIEKNVSKATKRNKYMESKGISMSELAKTQTKNININVSDKSDSSNKIKNQNKDDNSNLNHNNTSSSNPASISEIANILKNKNGKGDK